MTDDELRLMLDWRPSQIPFEQLPAEWKAWATAMIESAEVPADKHAHMRLEDSVQYLCRILCVFEGLFTGITEDDLRGKFVSGLVLSALPPARDCSFCFDQALRNAEGRGLVSHEDHGWGREQVRLYKLTPAGQRLATDVEPVQWENPSLRESPEADEPGAAIDVDGDEPEVQENGGDDGSKRKHPGYLSLEANTPKPLVFGLPGEASGTTAIRQMMRGRFWSTSGTTAATRRSSRTANKRS